MPPLFISILGYPWSTTLATPWISTSHLLNTTTAPAYYVLLLPWTSKILITLWKLDDNQDWKWLQQIANRQNHNQDNEHNHHPHQHHHYQSPPSSHSSLLLHSAIAPLLTSSSMLFPLSYHDICCDYLFSTLSAIAWYQETTFRPPSFPPSAATALPPHGSIYSSNSSLLATSVLVILLVFPPIPPTTSHHPRLPSCCCCCPPFLTTSIHLSCHRLCCCYYSNYFFSTLLTLAWYLENTISISSSVGTQLFLFFWNSQNYLIIFCKKFRKSCSLSAGVFCLADHDPLGF